MSHGRRHEASPVQLFPFLAVLVSALGALVLLLLTIQHRLTLQARAQAVQSLIDEVSSEELDLADRHSRLEHDVESLNSGIRGIRDQEAAADREIRNRDRKVQSDSGVRSALNNRLAAVRESRSDVEQQIAALRQQIAAIEAAKARWLEERPSPDRTFIPVIHPGANGTARRPIYIECTERGATFQPEGVVVSPAMLKRDGGARLARAVQALARYYLERDVGSRSAQAYREWEPYPLILVRPAGSMVFYPVRRALESADFNLGYELIEADWALQFPTADPAAREILEAAIRGTGAPLARSAGSTAGAAPGGELSDAAGVRSLASDSPEQLGIEPAGISGSDSNGVPQRGHAGVPSEARAPSNDSSAHDSATGGREIRIAFGNRSGGDSVESAGTTQRLPGVGSPETSGSSGPDRRLQPTRHEPFQPPGDMDADELEQAQVTAAANSGRPAHGTQRTAGDRTGSDTVRNAPASGDLGDADEQLPPVAGLLDPVGGNGKILVSRTIVLDCWDDSLILRSRGVLIPFPDSQPPGIFLTQLVREFEREVISWGPAGLTFRWKPTVLCLIHPGGLDSYHRLRMAFLGSSLQLRHLIAADDRIDWDDSIFLRRLDRSINTVNPWAE